MLEKEHINTIKDDKWISERIKSIETRNLLTDEYHKGGITEKNEFVLLTNILIYGWPGKNTREYKILRV